MSERNEMVESGEKGSVKDIVKRYGIRWPGHLMRKGESDRNEYGGMWRKK